jgi:hypothetical protein
MQNSPQATSPLYQPGIGSLGILGRIICIFAAIQCLVVGSVLDAFAQNASGVVPIGICASVPLTPRSTDERAAERAPIAAKSLTEVNKELTDPISTIRSLTFQENTYWIHPSIEEVGSRNQINVQFQPALPLPLNDNWNLINRPVLQALNSSPYVNGSASGHYVALAGMVALLAGMFLFVARIFELGFLADFLSQTVLVGFLTA